MHRLWHLRGFHPQHLHGWSSTRYLFPLVAMSRWIMNRRAFLHQWNSTSRHTLIMKFSAGRPNPYDIKLHIKNHWGLPAEPIIALVDPRHYLILPASYNDMVLAQAHEVHKIANCMFRLYRWTKILFLEKIIQRCRFGCAFRTYTSSTLTRPFFIGLEILSESYCVKMITRPTCCACPDMRRDGCLPTAPSVSLDRGK